IIELVDKDGRSLTTDQVALELRDQLTATLASFPDAEMTVGNASEEFAGGVSSGFSLALSSTDIELLRSRTAEAVRVLEDQPGLLNSESGLAEPTTERVFVVDAADLDGTGLAIADVYSTLRAYNVASEAGRLRDGSVDLPIVVSTSPRATASEQQLLSLPIYAPALQTELPLRSLGRFETRQAPGSISRLQQEFSAQISGDLAPGFSLSLVEAEARESLSMAGVLDDEVREQTEGTLDLLGDLIYYGPIAFGLALLL